MSTDDHTVSDLRALIAALRSQMAADHQYFGAHCAGQAKRIAELERERDRLIAATANDERDQP